MVRLIKILVCLLLTSCTTSPEVYIPVSQQHSVKIPKKSELKIKELKEVSTPDEVVKAYVVSVMQLKSENEELRVLLDGYQ